MRPNKTDRRHTLRNQIKTVLDAHPEGLSVSEISTRITWPDNAELCGSTELHDTLRGLYMALRNRHHGRMPDEVQAAYDKAGELIRRHEA